jgi:hypothetical protein
MRSAAQGSEYAAAYLEANAGLKDLTAHERDEARRRASQPLSSLQSPGLGAFEPELLATARNPAKAKPRRNTIVLGSICVIGLLYVASYIAFRQTHVEVWERDKQAYVIFPQSYGLPLYYVWRPLAYLDAAMTGMRYHIGPHR